MDERDKYIAKPPISLDCVNCGEKIYQSMDRWYHLNTGGVLCVDPYAARAVDENEVGRTTNTNALPIS